MKAKYLLSGLNIFIAAFLLTSCSEDKKKVTVVPKTTPSIIWGEPRNGLVLGIQRKKNEWKTSETAEFTVYLKNTGNDAVKIPFFFFGLSALELNIINEKVKKIYFVKECLSMELGDPTTLGPNKVITATQQVVLTKEGWEGSTGKYRVTAIYDTTDYKNDKLWKGRCTSGTLEFIVK